MPQQTSFSPDQSVAAQWEDLTVYQNKDADLTITITDPITGAPYNLTGLTVYFYRKPNRDSSDSSGIRYTCSVTAPATGGLATVTLPAADNSVSGQTWYRVDLVGAESRAVKFGRLVVFAV